MTGSLQCMKCGKELVAGAKFCIGCGTRVDALSSAAACASCGAKMREGARFCSSCGATVQAVAAARPLTCGSCGAPLRESVKFCTSCGKPVGKPAEQPAAKVVQAQSQPFAPVQPPLQLPSADGRRALTVVLAVCCVLLVGAVVFFFWKSKRTVVSVDPVDIASDNTTGGRPVRSGQDDTTLRPIERQQPGPGATASRLKFDSYKNKEFKFITEIPENWISEVKDNSLVFSGQKGTDQFTTTINIQIINKIPASSLDTQIAELERQWSSAKGYKRISLGNEQIAKSPAARIVVSYAHPGTGEIYMQDQVVIEHGAYYYYLGYTAPESLFTPYRNVMIRAVGKFKFMK